MVPEQQKRFPLFLLRIYYVGSGSLRGSMEFFLHLWESEDSWKIVSNFRMHAVLALLEPKMSIPYRGSGGESQIKKSISLSFSPPLTSGTRNTGLLQTFLSSSISLLLLLHTKYITPPLRLPPPLFL